MEKPDKFIERKILIGLIVSDEYIRTIAPMWSIHYMEASTAKQLSSWCIDYFKKYNKAPFRDIEGIFTEKIKKGLQKDDIEYIEEILESLNTEYENADNFNAEYLIDQTKQYFSTQRLKQYAEMILTNLEAGDIVSAEKEALSFVPTRDNEISNVIDPFASPMLIKQAFTEQSESLITFPKALGQFWNEQLTRGSFIAITGPEKRGKTFWLLEFAMRAMMNRNNVVFFQAGDMTEKQQLRRMAVYLSKRSDKERYCTERQIPCVDCWYNQTDTCELAVREQYGIRLFDTDMEQKKITFDMLMDVKRDYPEYKPCRNCDKMRGAVWLELNPAIKTLEWKDAYKTMKRWQRKYNNKFKLCTYPNETLTMQEINNLLTLWERQDGFVPDVILIDYADILAPDYDCNRLDGRGQINRIWQRMRKLSQEKHCLLITATQAAASSYDKETLSLSDFSEDKRKYAHTTATYSLNQTDEEKKIGIMRLGELVIRESEFDRTRQVKVLQCLQRGRPFIGSYF
jgi:archaellum biogenesis ATPase FlaH